MAGGVQGAVAGEISALKFNSDLMDADQHPARQQILPVAPYCFVSSQGEWMWVPPLSRAGYNHCVCWKS